MKKKVARLANTPQDYARIGILPNVIQQKEDGIRTNGKFGEYEWWYFDAKLLEPIIYDGVTHAYRSFGEKVGQAFSDEKR